MGRHNRTAFIVLGLLQSGPQSGYDLKQSIDEVTSHFWRESYGQLYPVLARLAREGLISRRRDRRNGRTRFEFALTAAGRQALRAWLHEPPQPEAVRHELLLKVFLGKAAPPEILAGHVRAFRDRNVALRDGLLEGRRQLAAQRERSVHFELTLLNGLYITEARLRWADEALAVLAAQSTGKLKSSARGKPQ